jgi:hypothetical protein
MKGIGFTGDDEHILYHRDLGTIKGYLDRGLDPPRFEAAGPRKRSFLNRAVWPAELLLAEVCVPALTT